jgi:hypothetical protein
MLTEQFIEWWFNPWGPAGNALAGAPDGSLAARLSYRTWCVEHGVRSDFPSAFDDGWQALAACDGRRLREAALLYGALLAAREGRHGALAGLPLDVRRWSLGTAATQPLARLCRPSGELEADGLRELACAMESGFPGMWDRLRRLLPGELAADAGAALTSFMLDGRVPGAALGAAARRRLRCWGLCLERARIHGEQGEFA